MKSNKEFKEKNPSLTDLRYLQDEFASAIVGYDPNLKKLAYSYDIMLENLVDEGYDRETSKDYLDYNVVKPLEFINNAPILLYEINF